MVSLSFIEISERLKKIKLPEVDLVIGIGTGGVVPASLAAFHLRKELQIMTLNYRDENNTPRYSEPIIINTPQMELKGKRILLVDDVSVSGETMNIALKQLEGFEVKTFTMKGKADFVLFPEIKECVKWPWKV